MTRAEDGCRLWTAETGGGAPLILCHGGPGLWDMFGSLAGSLAGDVRVVHAKGTSSVHRPVFVSRNKHRGMWRWFRKHDPAARNPIVAGIVWVGIWAHYLLQIPGQVLKGKGGKQETIAGSARDEER